MNLGSAALFFTAENIHSVEACWKSLSEEFNRFVFISPARTVSSEISKKMKFVREMRIFETYDQINVNFNEKTLYLMMPLAEPLGSLSCLPVTYQNSKYYLPFKASLFCLKNFLPQLAIDRYEKIIYNEFIMFGACIFHRNTMGFFLDSMSENHTGIYLDNFSINSLRLYLTEQNRRLSYLKRNYYD